MLSDKSQTPELLMSGSFPQQPGCAPMVAKPVTLKVGMLVLTAGSSVPPMISSLGRVASWLSVSRCPTEAKFIDHRWPERSRVPVTDAVRVDRAVHGRLSRRGQAGIRCDSEPRNPKP